jgi:hypothetical protein
MFYVAGIRDTVLPSLTLVSAKASGGVQPPRCTVVDGTVECAVPVYEEHPGMVAIKSIPTALETSGGPASSAHFTAEWRRLKELVASGVLYFFRRRWVQRR